MAVAEQDNEIAGWIAWSKSVIFVKSMSRFHIEGLIVDAKYQDEMWAIGELNSWTHK